MTKDAAGGPGVTHVDRIFFFQKHCAFKSITCFHPTFKLASGYLDNRSRTKEVIKDRRKNGWKCPYSLSVGQKPDRSEAMSLVGAWNMEGVETQHLQPLLLSYIKVINGVCLSIYCLHKREELQKLCRCSTLMAVNLKRANMPQLILSLHKDVILVSPMLILV